MFCMMKDVIMRDIEGEFGPLATDDLDNMQPQFRRDHAAARFATRTSCFRISSTWGSESIGNANSRMISRWRSTATLP
jgi:hypothetical protein